ncbi:HesA/MoeB/ThiF family protein [Candidatus Oleimmundimicrobium sp.]|uniref:HesA/MoeB/ThiF family protein n=1 Tax=Candidatus Oleimmundimicrobium sp. TaxID=3060597 RepID=UPI002728A00B|nr:HesA/MoeB/ThiF family protein [Candidatus Oleimmundimicrobium sp.]MDO8885419.1 HesA/MoeB/ThiF family protein [Candidatus Oleimmundimicrobium sp.]
MDDHGKEKIIIEIKKHFKKIKVSNGTLVNSISLKEVQKIAISFNLYGYQVEIMALENETIPRRYLRNIGTINIKGQIKLLKSKVAVVGLGGLGGTVVELLARFGVGRILVIDGDIFEESNLNRQLLVTEENIGEEKTISSIKRVAKINSSVKVCPYQIKAGEKEFKKILKDSDVIVSALDTFSTRLALQKAAKELKIPLIHGAIAGFIGEISTIFPEDPGLDLIDSFFRKEERGVEVSLGIPVVTPVLVAALQAQEVVKILLKIGKPLRNRLLFLDCETSSIEMIELK